MHPIRNNNTLQLKMYQEKDSCSVRIFSFMEGAMKKTDNEETVKRILNAVGGNNEYCCCKSLRNATSPDD